MKPILVATVEIHPKEYSWDGVSLKFEESTSMVALRYFLVKFMFMAKHLQIRVCVCVCDIEARRTVTGHSSNDPGKPFTVFERICLAHFILLQGFAFTGPNRLNQYLSVLEIHTCLKMECDIPRKMSLFSSSLYINTLLMRCFFKRSA